MQERHINRVFAKKIEWILEVDIDDMVVKTVDNNKHINDLDDILKSIRDHIIYLNPAKCSFGVQARKFLGFMVTQRSIEINTYKCDLIINMKSPSNPKEVQQLTGK